MGAEPQMDETRPVMERMEALARREEKPEAAAAADVCCWADTDACF